MMRELVPLPASVVPASAEAGRLATRPMRRRLARRYAEEDAGTFAACAPT